MSALHLNVACKSTVWWSAWCTNAIKLTKEKWPVIIKKAVQEKGLRSIVHLLL